MEICVMTIPDGDEAVEARALRTKYRRKQFLLWSLAALLVTAGLLLFVRDKSGSMIIGSILNAINQGPEIFSGHLPVWWKLMLTYFVPFAVASYGSYAAFRSSESGA